MRFRDSTKRSLASEYYFAQVFQRVIVGLRGLGESYIDLVMRSEVLIGREEEGKMGGLARSVWNKFGMFCKTYWPQKCRLLEEVRDPA